MEYFTEEFKKLIKQMADCGHENITIRFYPKDGHFCLSSEWNLDDKKKKVT